MSVFRIVIATVLGVLLLVLMYMQVLSARYSERAQSAFLSEVVSYPARGLVYDRQGELLVSNGPVYDLEVVYSQMDPEMDVDLLCGLLQISRSKYDQLLQKDWSDIRYDKSVAYTLIGRLTAEQYLAFQEHKFMFPGFHTVLRSMRSYQSQHAAHILGYVSEVDQQIIRDSDGIYSAGDQIGATGLERYYENDLRGAKGRRYILRDRYGRKLERYQSGALDTPAISGADLHLGLDIQLQAYAEELLIGKKGAVVAIDPGTGDILCMASAPLYTPSELAISSTRSRNFERLQADTLKPLFNRATMAKYPPGSIFKPILGALAIDRGLSSKSETYHCPGAYYYKTFRYGCHEHPSPVNMETAIAYSCNSYFFDLYRRLIEEDGFDQADVGMDKLHQELGQWGLGRALGVDLPSEQTGSVPDAKLYDDIYGRRKWRSTYTISLGIGQGELQLTTLQMANLAAIIANQGYYIEPHLVRSISERSADPTAIKYERHTTDLSKEACAVITDGMQAAVDYGTSRSAAIPGMSVCGKTGTSQNPQGKDHSVFFAFAPRENPQIAIAVYIENAGWGSTFASPIAGLVMEKYIRGDISREKRWWEDRMLTTRLYGDDDTAIQID